LDTSRFVVPSAKRRPEVHVPKLAEQFGKEVKLRRKARKMTQAELGEAAGLSEVWLRRIERGTGSPSFDAIEALANALGCAVADLFSAMSPRDAIGSRVDALLSDVPDADLPWLEDLIRVAVRRSSI
jgi:transcriptional regulator with XRE-family HTH domain